MDGCAMAPSRSKGVLVCIKYVCMRMRGAVDGKENKVGPNIPSKIFFYYRQEASNAPLLSLPPLLVSLRPCCHYTHAHTHTQVLGLGFARCERVLATGMVRHSTLVWGCDRRS